jgi:small subunit ribosomal protein S21
LTGILKRDKNTFRQFGQPNAQIEDGKGSHKEGNMRQIHVRVTEDFEKAFRRFNKKVKMEGLLSEARNREHFLSPSERRRQKSAASLRRAKRAA